MDYPTGQNALVVHARILDATSGAHGVRDVGLLDAAVCRPSASFAGDDLYQGVFNKAAALFESLAMNHVFVDGNKRTAIAASARFLFLNGHKLKVSNEELERFVLGAVENKWNLEEIAKWFEEHSEKVG